MKEVNIRQHIVHGQDNDYKTTNQKHTISII